jgi:hypothetical protein
MLRLSFEKYDCLIAFRPVKPHIALSMLSTFAVAAAYSYSCFQTSHQKETRSNIQRELSRCWIFNQRS